MLQFHGGNYAFNGSTTACDATFFFDFTDFVPANDEKNYYFLLSDSYSGNEIIIKNLEFIHNENVEMVFGGLPQSFDFKTKSFYMDYLYPYGNEYPEAIIIADKTEADPPAIIYFDGRKSIDIDGIIKSYHWDFGDGSVYDISSTTVSHAYSVPGTYKVTLTVEDNSGDQSESFIYINILFGSGDINGDGNIDQSDNLEMNRKMNGIYTIYSDDLFDLNRDGQVDQQDRLILNRLLNGIPPGG